MWSSRYLIFMKLWQLFLRLRLLRRDCSARKLSNQSQATCVWAKKRERAVWKSQTWYCPLSCPSDRENEEASLVSVTRFFPCFLSQRTPANQSQRSQMEAELRDIKETNLIMRSTLAKIRTECNILESEIHTLKNQLSDLSTERYHIPQMQVNRILWTVFSVKCPRRMIRTMAIKAEAFSF